MLDTDTTITALESKTFWASLLGLGAMVATLLGQSQLAGFFSSPDTLTQVLAGVGAVFFVATGIGRVVAKRKISGVVETKTITRAVPAMLALGLIGMSLSACSPITTLDAAFGVVTGAKVSPQAALVAQNTFDELEQVALTYGKLPLCGSPGASAACRTQAATLAIAPAVRSGRRARNEIQAALRAGNGAPIPVFSYNSLQAAVQTIETAYAEYNIGK